MTRQELRRERRLEVLDARRMWIGSAAREEFARNSADRKQARRAGRRAKQRLLLILGQELTNALEQEMNDAY